MTPTWDSDIVQRECTCFLSFLFFSNVSWYRRNLETWWYNVIVFMFNVMHRRDSTRNLHIQNLQPDWHCFRHILSQILHDLHIDTRGASGFTSKNNVACRTYCREHLYVWNAFSGWINGVLFITKNSQQFLHRKKPTHASVNCWFCNQNTVVPYGNRNCWDCPNCDQYNGFQEVCFQTKMSCE